ncbi:hypothetical protein [Nocardioides speluncae]|nr:hypothetical protein [Nocardioides speluncae]
MSPIGGRWPRHPAPVQRRDKYTVDVANPSVDFRFAAAMAVALDALMSR